jgi:2-polyprenyl-3-methyl-5-hydroxy-6-metoxy-1,4-benzoquinol methylase
VRRAERFYDGHAEEYESKFALPVARRVKRAEEEAILAFLFEHLPPEGRLLELGCGTGLFTLPVAARGYEITAVDISSKMLQRLRRKLDAAPGREHREHPVDTYPSPPAGTVSLLRADVEDLSALGRFDGVYGIGLLEYLDSPGAVVKRAAGLLRPGGVACFTGPTLSVNGWLYRAISLLRKRIRMQLFTRRGMEALFTAAGLEPIELRDVGCHLPLMTPLTRVGAAMRPEASRKT